MPVLDGGLVHDASAATTSRPGSTSSAAGSSPVSTCPPTRGSPRASRGARRSGSRQGQVKGQPRLVVLPRDIGKLAWEVNVFAAGQSDAGVQLSDGLYYLDAVSAELLEVRPTTAELAAPSVFSKLLSKGSPQVSRRLTQMVLASLDGPKGQPVDVTGNAPYLGRVTAKGLRDNQGVSLDRHHDAELQRGQRQGRHLHLQRRRVEQQLQPARPPLHARARPRSATPTRSAPRRSAGSSTTTTPASAATPGTARARRWSRRSTSATATSATPSSAPAWRRWSTATRARARTATCSWSPST